MLKFLIGLSYTTKEKNLYVPIIVLKYILLSKCDTKHPLAGEAE